MLNKLHQLSIIKWLRNLYSSMKYDLHKDDNIFKSEIKNINEDLNLLKDKISLLKKELLYEKIMRSALENSDFSVLYSQELNYIRENENLFVFPYKQIKKHKGIQSGYDISLKLPYVYHNQKKLYFPGFLTEEQAGEIYVNFIENENILGGGYKEKAPHQYQTDMFYVNNGDVFVDVGCAEALFALDVVDKVKKVYLFESDEKWLDALRATFNPYKEKVIIINKLVSNIDSETTITLSSALKNEKEESLFIKMDIEGYETSVIAESQDFLQNNDNIKLTCCTYHKQNDAEKLKEMFEKYGYNTEFSDGYMLFNLNELKYPYFRKGIIRAWKNDQKISNL